MNPESRTQTQVAAALAKAARNGSDKSFARLMLNHGNLTAEARAYVEGYLA